MLADLMTEIVKRPHPALVHFAMGLYPVSAVFGLLFIAVENSAFLQTSYWCFIIASLFMLPIAITGLLDYIRLKAHSHKAHRLLMLHLANGAIATVFALISGFYFWRNSPVENAALIQLFLVCSILLSLMVLAQGAIAALMIYQHKLGVDGETR